MNCLDCPKADTCTTLCPEMREELQSVEVVWHEDKPDTMYLNGEVLRVFNVNTGRDSNLLTYRQWQILNAKTIGFKATEIAEKLNITASTVRTLLSIAKRKCVYAVLNK